MAESVGVEVGEIVECTVEQIMPYGAFVRITKTGRKGMIHISELSYSFVKDINAVLKTGDKTQAKVIRIDDKGRIDLSLKQTQEPPAQPVRPPRRIVQNQQNYQQNQQTQDTNGRPPRDFRSPSRNLRGTGEFRERERERERDVQKEYRESNPEEADTFEKKMASFLKTSEAKITDLNTRNSARSGRPTRRRNNSREY